MAGPILALMYKRWRVFIAKAEQFPWTNSVETREAHGDPFIAPDEKNNEKIAPFDGNENHSPRGGATRCGDRLLLR